MRIRFPKILLCLSLLLTACSDDQEVVAQGLTDGSKGTVLRNQTIHSEILRRDMLYSIYLPAGYTDSKQYPVLYLLHGWGGDQNEWWVYDDMADDADAMIASGEGPEMIILTPDGQTWRYIDNWNGNGLDYEQYFFEELMPYIETRYSIRRERQSRAIGESELTDMGSIVTNYQPSVLPGITLECGDRDYFTYDNRDFSAQLTQLGIAHEHIERNGGHDWEFWSACTPKMLRKVGGLFRQGTTDIRSTRADSSKQAAIYSLSGTRRDTLQKGINIVNGKKIIR